jgi:hypothetical protein
VRRCRTGRVVGAVIAVTSLLGACGDSSKDAGPLGSPSTPQVGRDLAGAESQPDERAARQPSAKKTDGGTPVVASKSTAKKQSGSGGKPASSSSAKKGLEPPSKIPGYQGVVAGGSRKPTSRLTPCSLVTKSQAEAIIGTTILVPLEATQGPTCIYRTKSGKSFVTVAVQRENFKKIRPQIRQPERFSIASRTAYCGTFGQPMLYMPLSGGRVLSIAAPCDTAREFAIRAISQLNS